MSKARGRDEPSWCRQSSKDDSYLLVHHDAARQIPQQEPSWCRQSSKDDSYLLVHQDAARQIPHQEPATPKRSVMARRNPSGPANQHDLPSRVKWIPFNRETASKDGDLVDAVVMTVSPVCSYLASCIVPC